MEFSQLKEVIQRQMDEMFEDAIFVTDVDKDKMWELYLSSFPAGSNNMFRERTEHDCSCCKSFIRNGGNMVNIVDGRLISIWDVEIGGAYQVVVDALSDYVKSAVIKDIFLHTEGTIGVDYNFDTDTGSKWEHFYYKLPVEYVQPKDADKLKGIARANKEVLKRGLDELTLDAFETVTDLIMSNSLYRGEEHKLSVGTFFAMKLAYSIMKEEERDNYCWKTSQEIGGAGKFRNTVIGTLVTDISDGVELEKAVASFEAKVAPQNYKRTTAVVSKKMIENAQAMVQQLGVEDSLYRRHSTQDDVPVQEVLFVNRDTLKELGLFDMMKKEVKVEAKTFKMQELSIAELIDDVLPNANSLEVLFDNKHLNNLVSLVSPQYPESPSILKWDNNFTWSYRGEVADSLRDQVVSLGGRVDGVLRFTHTWNYDGQNQSLMDLHVFMPHSGYKPLKKKANLVRDSYPSGPRVGWNRRNDSVSGGVQDVDYTSAPGTSVPVENITFPSFNRLEDGNYDCLIHNWSFRNPTTSGFKAEIECNGEIHKYHYPDAVKQKEWIRVATATLKGNKFSMKHHLQPDTEAQEVWGISTKSFHKVNMLMNSPNHWGDNESGNKHWFFILEGCETRDSVRGFYNEYLSGELNEHRKVFELLGSKTKVEYSKQQMSGLGFSSTVSNTLVCKVDGRLYNVTI